MGEGDLPTLSTQDRGSEAENKGDEQQGGHGCGPLLQKTPRTWPAPQSPLPGPLRPQLFPMSWLQDKDGVLASPPAQQLSPTKAIAAAKPRPRIKKQLRWQWTQVQGEREGACCSNQDALHIHFTINIVTLQGQGSCMPHSQPGLRPCCHPSLCLQIPSKQPASQMGHRHTVLCCWGSLAAAQHRAGEKEASPTQGGGRQLAARFTPIATHHPVQFTATPAAVMPLAPKAARERDCESSSAGVQLWCTNGFTVDAVMGLTLRGAEAGDSSCSWSLPGQEQQCSGQHIGQLPAQAAL